MSLSPPPTIELSAAGHALFPLLCGTVFCDFQHACHRRQIFNVLNNFVKAQTFPDSVRAFLAISSVVIRTRMPFSPVQTKVPPTHQFFLLSFIEDLLNRAKNVC